ncbi:hypothetical protein BGZ60DRAFT_395159 [Tricladium varicosporioides]|nr:hypothetical protein BGZ60DRAFT_395159 [Hymenoscyphus varicosporioides]
MLEHPLHFTQDWALFEEDSFAVEELSFTRFGFPSSESRKYMKNDGSATEIWTKLRQHVAQTSNSQQETIILGRSWTICPGSRTMPLSTLGFSSSQVILGHDLDIAEVAECAIVFPKRYVGPWPINTWTNWCCVGNTRLHVQFHVRYLSPQLSAITGSDPKCKYSGLRFERDGWRICGESTEYSIAEARSSIAILTSLWHQLPCYSMVTLTDTSGFLLDYVEDKISWNDTELRPCHEFAGVIIFQLAVRRLIMEWEEQWDSTLKLIMSIPRSQVVVQRRDLRSGEFEVQQRNFTIRELLFKSCDMIRELTDDLQSLKNDLDASTTVIAHNSVGENFEMLVIYQKGIESRLLGVIQRMLAEIDPLNVLDTLPPRS